MDCKNNKNKKHLKLPVCLLASLVWLKIAIVKPLFYIEVGWLFVRRTIVNIMEFNENITKSVWPDMY